MVKFLFFSFLSEGNQFKLVFNREKPATFTDCFLFIVVDCFKIPLSIEFNFRSTIIHFLCMYPIK